MRFLLLTGTALALIGAACGGGSTSAEGVVRAWSSAVNAGDNETAADQFATNAEIVQGGVEQRLRNRADAVDWNAGLPCSGRIVRLDAAPALLIEGVHEAGFYWREGMMLPPLTSGAERLGYLLLSAPDEEELDARTNLALQALDVEIAAESALV